ncbi:MAG: hypothetical protein KatS3mg105_4402 [Gemmatales bacterium]|nr:MAG: hypothetical protein KatS3mg105_1051 [Gemmatales bacterium]GIW82595.1 MAG: hypothetical protein KatS3mg105_4402 [Gemmatales bacterium]
MAFQCPTCDKPMRVLRTTHSRDAILRRRICPACGFRMTTAERRLGDRKPATSARAVISIAQLVRDLELQHQLLSQLGYD